MSVGMRPGSRKISAFGLNELATIQSSGYSITKPKAMRPACLSTLPILARRCRPRGRTAGRRSSVPGRLSPSDGGRTAVVVPVRVGVEASVIVEDPVLGGEEVDYRH